MPIDLAQLVAPARTALVTQEIQRGVVGEESALPALADAAARVGLVENVAKLLDAARDAGVRVVHCIALRRPDGFGANRNARIFAAMARAEQPLHPGSRAAELMPGIGARDDEPLIERFHGVSPFHGTELDWWLRNEGVSTIVGVGVSVNVAIQNLAFDALNSGYQMVVPRDAVAGVPDDYVDAVFEHTLRVVATTTTTAELIEVWQRA